MKKRRVQTTLLQWGRKEVSHTAADRVGEGVLQRKSEEAQSLRKSMLWNEIERRQGKVRLFWKFTHVHLSNSVQLSVLESCILWGRRTPEWKVCYIITELGVLSCTQWLEVNLVSWGTSGPGTDPLHWNVRFPLRPKIAQADLWPEWNRFFSLMGFSAALT